MVISGAKNLLLSYSDKVSRASCAKNPARYLVIEELLCLLYLRGAGVATRTSTAFFKVCRQRVYFMALDLICGWVNMFS